MGSRRSTVTVGALALALTGFGALPAMPAQAAAYRYWTYWQGSPAGWTFATAGPAATAPKDGSVEGWRFAVTTQSGSAQDAPGTPPDFGAICDQTPPVPGKKRVALVVDPGAAAIAPAGQTPPPAVTTCVVADASATGYQVLRAAATVRTDSGLICAIADYPTGECAPVVDDPVPQPTTSMSTGPAPATTASPTPVDVSSAAQSAMPAATGQPSQSSTPWATIAVVVVAAGAALIVWWRRRG